MKSKVTYYRCQSCKENIHCDGCEKLVLKYLAEEPEISNVQLDLTAKEISFDTTVDADTLEEVLEDAGIYLA